MMGSMCYGPWLHLGCTLCAWWVGVTLPLCALLFAGPRQELILI